MVSMEEGTFLRFVISPEGITIDPGRIEAINAIVLPHNENAMQSFSWKNKLCEKIHFRLHRICKAITRDDKERF